MLYAHLRSQVHPIQGMMVRVCSVWSTLPVWCLKFQVQGPSLFAIPSPIVKLCLFQSMLKRNVICSSSFTGASNPGNVVRVCSVWYTLPVWCLKFQVQGPSLFAIPSPIVKLCLFQSMLKRNVVCSSSFTGASNPGNDCARVFSVAYSTPLVHKISGSRTFTFCHT